ncbi:hypothetical protein D9Q98_004591 [Chlorella vulgaris]|uniref:Uncharacterized protein n=1 Tax=Chlorella vulgaris TaxID=3077 RepID=A0A9D4TQ79_CHLVU|nr:hypothetical protein D9Q98_004591 [Chlorella vulgaris]
MRVTNQEGFEEIPSIGASGGGGGGSVADATSAGTSGSAGGAAGGDGGDDVVPDIDDLGLTDDEDEVGGPSGGGRLNGCEGDALARSHTP